MTRAAHLVAHCCHIVIKANHKERHEKATTTIIIMLTDSTHTDTSFQVAHRKLNTQAGMATEGLPSPYSTPRGKY